MRQKFGRHINSFIPALCGRMAEVDRVPIDDDGGDQVKAGDPEMLTLGGSGDATLSVAQRFLGKLSR
jgi:hypothetical protein